MYFPAHISILGEVAEVVEDYTHLRVYLDNRLEWKSNTEAVDVLLDLELGTLISPLCVFMLIQGHNKHSVSFFIFLLVSL